MYTYERPFVGLRLSQFEYPSKTPFWLVELAELIDLYHLRLEFLSPDAYDPEGYSELEYPQTRVFLEWVVENHARLKKLKLEMQSDYHGDGDEPVIFGKYLDRVYPSRNLHSPAAVKKLQKIQDLDTTIHALFSTLPKKLFKDIKPLLGVSFNEHSS